MPTFGEAAIRQHKAKAPRVNAAIARAQHTPDHNAKQKAAKKRRIFDAKESAYQQKINDECHDAPNHRTVVSIGVREAVRRFGKGREATVVIPFHNHAKLRNITDMWRSGYDDEFGNVPTRSDIEMELTNDLRKSVDCKFALSVAFEGGEYGDEHEPAMVTLTLIPPN
jgi:hypothetical protein